MVQAEYGALILAGGQGKRMGGIQKAALTLGKTTFLSILEKNLSFLGPGYLSTNVPRLAQGTGLEPVEDLLPDRGPMGGIYSVLKKCSCDAVLTVPCDMPFFSGELARFLLEEHRGEAVLYLQDEGGREFPLCGIYTRDCIPAIEKLMKLGDLSVRRILKQAGGRLLPVPPGCFPSRCFFNVNTLEEYYLCEKELEEVKAVEMY